MDREEYDDLLRRMAALVAHLDGYITSQEARNDKLDAAIEELRAFNHQQVAINTRLETTLQAIKDILGRDNGC